MEPSDYLDLQLQLQRMDDGTLRRFAKAAKDRCSAESQSGQIPSKINPSISTGGQWQVCRGSF